MRDAMIAMARGAGAILRRAYSEPVEVEHKGAIDLVTNADKESEAYVLQEIARQFPEHSILAEESGHGKKDGSWRWIIDPLDGTINFAHRVPHFCVLIAVQQRVSDAYQTQMGVTYDPMRDEMFVVERGLGATLNGAPIQVSTRPALIESLGATGFSYERLWKKLDNHAEYCRLNLLSRGVRRMGSAGLDLAYVACGRYDFYWEYELKAWDYSPGVLMVTEAGGQVTDLDGNRFDGFTALDGDHKATFLSSNQVLHTKTLEALQSAHAYPINAREGLAPHLPVELARRLNTNE